LNSLVVFVSRHILLLERCCTSNTVRSSRKRRKESGRGVDIYLGFLRDGRWERAFVLQSEPSLALPD